MTLFINHLCSSKKKKNGPQGPKTFTYSAFKESNTETSFECLNRSRISKKWLLMHFVCSALHYHLLSTICKHGVTKSCYEIFYSQRTWVPGFFNAILVHMCTTGKSYVC